MRIALLWTYLRTCLLIVIFVPLAASQDLEQLQKTIKANLPATLPPDLGRKPPTPELVTACKTVIDAAAQIYALPNLNESDRQWTVKREAAALIILAYADTPTYYPRLTLMSDELEKRGLPKLVEEIEKHILEIGSDLTTRTGNNAVPLNIESLAERMVLYAEQYPSPDSIAMIERFLQRIRAMNAAPRDRRLAIVAPIFQQYFKSTNHTAMARALNPDISRATLPGQPMLLMGVDINGKDFDLLSVKDKVVLIQFWGTWCPGCLAEIPDLITLYEKYHAAGLEIIGINTGVKGDNEKVVKQFLETKQFNGKKIPWMILHEGLGNTKNNMTITKFYGIDELPVLILVGRDGKVLNLHPLPATLDDLVAKATSLLATVESTFTEEEKKQYKEVQKKQNEATDQQIKTELSRP